MRAETQQTFSLERSHPLAKQILAAAEREDGQAELAALLKQAGVPGDVLGEVSSVARAGRAEIADPEPRAVEYEVVDGAHVMLVYEAFRSCASLVARAEEVGGWGQSTQVAADGSTYAGPGRTSRSLRLAGDPRLAEFEAELRATVCECAQLYAAWNRKAAWVRDHGFGVLRYEPGEQYEAHVDAVAGHPTEGGRQLSVVVYLNDGFDDGETYFPLQDFGVRPPAGTVVLFPSFWTHPHAALPPTGCPKYVAVGWLYSA